MIDLFVRLFCGLKGRRVFVVSDLRVAPQPTYEWVGLNPSAEPQVTAERHFHFDWWFGCDSPELHLLTSIYKQPLFPEREPPNPKPGDNWLCWELQFCTAVRPELDLIPIVGEDAVAQPKGSGSRPPLRTGTKHTNAKFLVCDWAFAGPKHSCTQINVCCGFVCVHMTGVL